NFDRLLVFRAELVQLVGIHDDVLTLGVLVAGDDLVALNFSVDGADLLVLNAAVAFSVELVEVNFPAAGRGGIGFDRDGDETELEETFPAGTCCHCDPFESTSRPCEGHSPRSSK